MALNISSSLLNTDRLFPFLQKQFPKLNTFFSNYGFIISMLNSKHSCLRPVEIANQWAIWGLDAVFDSPCVPYLHTDLLVIVAITTETLCPLEDIVIPGFRLLLYNISIYPC